MSASRFFDLYTAARAATVAVTGVSAAGAVGNAEAVGSGVLVTGVEATGAVGSVHILAPHIRQQIRDRVASVLTTGVALVSSRVYTSRVYPLSEAKLPAIAVYTSSETSNLMSFQPPTLQRSMSLTVDVYARAVDTFDDDVDAICVQIEDAIGDDFRVNGLAKQIHLISTDIDYNGEAEHPVGIASMTFEVSYVTSITDASTAR